MFPAKPQTQRGDGEQKNRTDEDLTPAVRIAHAPGERHHQDLPKRVDSDRPAAPVHLRVQVALY